YIQTTSYGYGNQPNTCRLSSIPHGKTCRPEDPQAAPPRSLPNNRCLRRCYLLSPLQIRTDCPIPLQLLPLSHSFPQYSLQKPVPRLYSHPPPAVPDYIHRG